jgi:hypothetical protein
MTTNNEPDKPKVESMDDLLVKSSKIPKFTPANKISSAITDGSKNINGNIDAVGIASAPKLRVLRGGGAEIPKVNIAQVVDASKAGNKNIESSSSTASVPGVIDKKTVVAELQAKGAAGKKVPLDELAKVLLRQMGMRPEDIERLESLDSEERAKALARISDHFASALRQEKGQEVRGGPPISSTMRAAEPGASATVGSARIFGCRFCEGCWSRS